MAAYGDYEIKKPTNRFVFLSSKEHLDCWTRQGQAIIADYKWWIRNESDLEKWFEEYTEKGTKTQEGMILNFSNEQELLHFKLRWDGPYGA